MVGTGGFEPAYLAIIGAESEIRTHDCQAVKPGLLPLNYSDKSRAHPYELDPEY